jgi:hypothetical protein
MGVLLAGCGLNTVPQPVPAVPSQSHDLRPASAWVVDRMTRAAPDLYFDSTHTLCRGTNKAPSLKSLLLSRRSSMIFLT